MPTIEGYAERGVVNALFESIVASKEPNKVLPLLLECAKPVLSGYGERTFLSEAVTDFKVYVEPSLSDFGCPDAVVFIDTADSHRSVIFVEAKLETFCSSCRAFYRDKDTYQRNGSTILHELFLKARFVDALTREEYLGEDHPLNKGFHVYEKDAKNRKIGTDPLVLELVLKIRECIAGDVGRVAFLALTTDREPEATDWKTVSGGRQDICNHIRTIDGKENGGDNSRFSPRDPEEYWLGMTYLWGWQDIHRTAQWIRGAGEESMERLLRTIEWNEPKFRFPQIEPRPDEKTAFYDRFFAKIGLRIEKSNKPCEQAKVQGRSTYYSKSSKRAVMTVCLVESFGGPALDVYLLPRGERKAEAFKIGWNDLKSYGDPNTCSGGIEKIIKHKEYIDSTHG